MGTSGGAAIRLEVAGGRGVVLRAGGDEVEVRGAQPALLLARLVLGRPVALPRNELAELLWPDGLPTHWAGAARQIVSRARRAVTAVGLEASRLRSEGGVVALDLADLVVGVDVEEALADLEAAADALADGRVSEARRLGAAALAVTGQPFLPAAGGAWVDQWRGRLAAAQRRAELLVARAALGEGALGDAVDQAAALVAADPTDEPATRLLMEAHEAAGNRAAALAAHEQLRRRLDDELGVRPSPETDALHLRILGEAPVGPAPVASDPLRVPRATGAGGRFIGRVAERSELGEAWRRTVTEQRLHIVVVEGEAGIGKTRLAAEAAADVADAGGRVLWGAVPAVGGLPKQPLGALVDAVLAHDPVVAGHLVPFAAELASIGVDLGSVPPPAAPADDARTHARLDRALAAAFELGLAAPALVVVDDLQLVAPDTLASLHHVVATVATRPVLVVVTARQVRGGAARLLAAWERLAPVRTLALAGWSRAEVAEAIGEATGDGTTTYDIGDVADEVLARTAGNPLFVTQFVRHVGRGGLDLDALPVAVADVVDRRVAALDPADAATLGLAAVVGGQVPVGVVEACAAEPALVVDQLDRLRREGFLVEEDAERFGFVHEVVREAVVAGLGPTRAGRLHQRVADALAATGGEPGAVAAHYVEAGPRAAEAAAWWSVAAGNAALRAASWTDATTHFERALGARPTPEVSVPARIGLGRARRALGDRDGARAVLDEAVALAAAHGRGRELAAATLSLVGGGGRGVAVDLPDAERAALLRQALVALEHAETTPAPTAGADADAGPRPPLVAGADELLVDVLGELALALVLTDHVDERRALCERAVEVARASGAPHLLAAALVTRRIGLMGPDHTPARAAEAAEVLRLPVDEVPVERRLAALLGLVEDHLELGDRAVVDAALAEAREVADALDHPYWSWATACWEVLVGMVDGELDEVEDRAFAALAHQADHPEAMAALGVQLVDLRLFQGRSGEMLDLLAGAADDNPHIPAYRATLALCAAEAGDEATARAAIDHFAARGFAVPHDSNELLAVAVLGDACATVAADEHAPVLLDRLRPWADRQVVLNCYGGGGAFWGPVSLVCARLARRIGLDAEADAWLADAEASAAAVGSPWFVTRARSERSQAEQLHAERSRPARSRTERR